MGLTDEEQVILKKTAELWNLLVSLPDKHPHFNEENMRDIHNLQCRLLSRVAKRTNPDLVN